MDSQIEVEDVEGRKARDDEDEDEDDGTYCCLTELWG